MNSKYNICTQCENFNNTLKTCKLCGCFMPAKTLVPGSRCPEDKWEKITVESTGAAIKQNTTPV